MVDRGYTLTIKGLEAAVTLCHGIETTSAHGMAFDEDAHVIADLDSLRFSGFCDAEIVRDIAGKLLVTRRQIEYEDIDAALDELALTCACED